MKLRGTSGGLNLLLETVDDVHGAEKMLETRAGLLAGSVTIEIAGSIAPAVLELVLETVKRAGGTISGIRAARASNDPPPTARTEIIARTLRSGARIEVGGSVIVLGDVNPGVELIAGGDVIVLGALRGLAHAGVNGREDVIVWARPINAPQIRIAGVTARAPEGSSLSAMRTKGSEVAELARLENGQIVIETFKG